MGEIGKLLQEATANASLSQTLKDQFGGLKKFLEKVRGSPSWRKKKVRTFAFSRVLTSRSRAVFVLLVTSSLVGLATYSLAINPVSREAQIQPTSHDVSCSYHHAVALFSVSLVSLALTRKQVIIFG